MRKLLFGLFIVMFANIVCAQIDQPPAESMSEIRFFAMNDDIKESDVRFSIAKQIRADLKEHGSNIQLLTVKSWWYYDCREGRIICFNLIKKSISILVDPKESKGESQLIRLDKSDFQKLGIDLDAILKVDQLLNSNAGMSGESPPFALRATKVLNYEDVRKLIGKE